MYIQYLKTHTNFQVYISTQSSFMDRLVFIRFLVPPAQETPPIFFSPFFVIITLAATLFLKEIYWNKEKFLLNSIEPPPQVVQHSLRIGLL